MHAKIRSHLLTGLILFCLSTSGFADEPFPISPAVNDQVVAVAYVDVRNLEIPKLVQWSVERGLITAKQASDSQMGTAMAQGVVAGLVDAGIERLFVLFRVEDVGQQSPLWCATVAEDGNLERARGVIEGVLGMVPEDSELLRSQTIGVKDRLIIGAQNQTVLNEFIEAENAIRPEFDSAWQEACEYDLGLIVAGNQDTRRVIRELLPELPAPFEEVSATHIADQIQWGQVNFRILPESNARICIQHVGQEPAERAKRLIETTLNYADNVATEEFKQPWGNLLQKHIKPTVTNRKVTLDLNWLLDQETIAFLASGVRTPSNRSKRMNNMRQVILAMLFYESEHGGFPPTAICSADGTPLLSWRVAILPFVEQNKLYKQFRLDEPWDSPHNLKLVSQMPDLFADPAIKLGQPASKGRTRIQLPVGKGFFGDGVEGLKIRAVTDGTSNTIAVVNIAPANAVVWTKPADWQADPSNPWEGLAEGDQETILAIADGSTRAISRQSVDAATLQAYLTYAGGEVVNGLLRED